MNYVIGAGPAGMMAAIAAARRGKAVTLLERNNRFGKKLSITGKGRCNMTNACDLEDFFTHIPTNPSFLYSALYTFTNEDTVRFFEELGVPTKVERGGRVFPQSDRAGDVVDAMARAMKEAGVQVVLQRVKRLVVTDGAVSSIITEQNNFPCESVVLATGGASYPQTGSTGDGYAMARALGHTVLPQSPSLVPLVTVEDTSELQGLALKNCAITVRANGKKLYDDFGEMLFTHFGLSGPIVLSASSHLHGAEKGAVVSIDLKPALTVEELDRRILRDFQKQLNRQFGNALSDLLPSKMIPYFVQRSGIPADEKVHSITRQQRAALVDLFKNLTFTVRSFRPLVDAIITRGGVATSEINPSTMESKLVRNLYFAGEIIDVDAYTGGYNLQIAFSTGHLAGESLANGEES